MVSSSLYAVCSPAAFWHLMLSVPASLHQCLGKEGAYNCTDLLVFVFFGSLSEGQNAECTCDS